MSARVGVIGLGAIGLPLSVNLIGKGFEVGFRRSPMHELESAGGHPAASPRAMAEACDVIVTVLPTHEDVREVIEGPNRSRSTATRPPSAVRSRLEVLVAGNPRSLKSRFLNVWKKGPKGWQMVAWQSTPAPS